jgi:hypothetical protein
MSQVDRLVSQADVLFNGVQAGQLMERLRSNTVQIERDLYGGRFPVVVHQFVQDALAVCQKLIDNHKQEAARGWDPQALLRQHAAYVLRRLRQARHESLGA